jgi:signal transduction histidine kinase
MLDQSSGSEETPSQRTALGLSAARGGSRALMFGAVAQLVAMASLASTAPQLWREGGVLFRVSLCVPALGALAAIAVLWPRLRGRLVSVMEQSPSAEHSQIVVRLIFSAIIACWAYGAAWIEPAGAMVPLATAVNCVFPLPFGFLFDVLRNPSDRGIRRHLGIALDGVAPSVCLATGGAIAALWWPTYLWTIFGQGMRFGLRTLVEATTVNILGFAVVLAVSPYWQERAHFAASIFLALVALPAYAGILVSRLQAALASADAANRAKGRFLAVMSHELRSPLNAIIGFSEMIRDEVAGPLGAVRYKEWSADINTAGKHLLTLITDLLDFSKLEVDRLELDVDMVDLGELAASCLKFVAPRAEKYGIALTLDVQPSTGVFLHGDALRLRQIVINLLSNAVKFSDPGGAVRMLVEDRGRDGFMVSVSDSGVGMRPEDIPRALEPYGQVDASRKRRQEGTGLGLPLAKALAEKHGGSLEIDSAIGQGTTVRICLPAARRCAIAAPTNSDVAARADSD